MGLDMYLERRHYVKRWGHLPADRQFIVTVTRGGEPFAAIRPERVSEITEQVGYWRKANAIHRWFINQNNGVDDCKEFCVSKDQLRELLAAVTAVLDGADAATTLPTQSGFFFGSTDYGEDYRTDLVDTQQILTPLLAEENDEADYYYRASW